jgi:hypothetical protein
MKGIYVSLLFVLMACSSSVPKDILPPDQMFPVMRDMVLVDELINNQASTDTTVDPKVKRSKLYEQVFVLHNTDRQQFYKSFRYYQRHPDRQKLVFDSLSEGLKRKEPPVKATGRQPQVVDKNLQ